MTNWRGNEECEEHFTLELTNNFEKNETKERTDQQEIPLQKPLETLNTTCKKKFEDAKVKIALMLLNWDTTLNNCRKMINVKNNKGSYRHNCKDRANRLP